MFYSDRTDINKLINSIKNIKKFLKKVKFDGFIGTGLSGVTVASMLAFSMRKRLVVVRKDEDKNHSCAEIEGINYNDKQLKLIVVDDFVCSGSTIKDIIKKVKEKKVIKLLGLVLYQEDTIPPKNKLHGLKLLKCVK